MPPTGALKPGVLVLTFYWEILKDHAPLQYVLKVSGYLSLAVAVILVFSVFFMIGLFSKSVWARRNMQFKIEEAREELIATRQSIEDEKKRLSEVRNTISAEEEKRLSEELVKTETGRDEGFKEEKSKLKAWRVLEKDLKDK